MEKIIIQLKLLVFLLKIDDKYLVSDDIDLLKKKQIKNLLESDEVELLDKGLIHYAEIIRRDIGKNVEDIAGSGAKYTWKTEPNTSKTGKASGEVKVTYSDGSQDDVPVTINVKDKLDDNEKYHIYGKDGLKVNKDQTLDPKDAIDVKDADGNETTLPEGSTVGWTETPDFSQAGKDVTGKVTVIYPDHTKSDPVTVTVHVNGKSDEYKVAPRDGVTVQRGGQVDPETTVVAQTPDGKPTSFPDGTKHK